MGILDFFYPKRCVGCKKVGTYFCAPCIKVAKLHFPQVCPVCEKPSPLGTTHKRCATKYTPDGLLVIWRYEGTPRKLIHKLKYKFASDLALSLASPAANLMRRTLQKGKFTIVPIPLHWQRRNWRGFNQAEEIAKLLAGEMGWEVNPLLKRKKPTKQQVGLKKSQRKENIKGAFALAQSSNQQINKSTNILIFDDVWTSGSTMREAVKVLKKAGFRRVWCLTLAR